MKSFTFPSLERPTFRYRLYNRMDDNPAHDWRRSQYCLSPYISMYDTMGDGEVQHCSDGLVPTEMVMDVVFSLSCALDRVPIGLDGEDSGIEPLDSFWRHRPSVNDADIRFLLTLKYVDNKDTYYTIQEERKKSFSDSKRHDKRWLKLERPYDENESTVARVMRLIPEREMPSGTIQWVATVMRIAELAEPDNEQWATVKHLRGDGKNIFNHPRYEQYEFLTHFQNITQFLEGVWAVRNARSAAARRRLRLTEEMQSQELQTA